MAIEAKCRRAIMNRLVLGVTSLLVGALTSISASAQGNLRQSLERLDRNDDGVISPDEITPLARPYLERIAKAKRLSLGRDNDISDYQEAARIYYASKNGVMDERVRAEPDETLKSFRPDDETVLVPEFGLAEVKYEYTREDVEQADDTMRRCDRDRNGYIDRREARRNRWTHRDPFEMDLNGDNLLSRMELIQRYARRRLVQDDARELVQRAFRVGNGIEPSRKRPERRDDDSRWWARRGGNSYWLTSSLMERFDLNRNGRLEANESVELGLPVASIDLDRDGEITREELFGYTDAIQKEAGDPGEGIPGWFFELDKDRDKQVTMPEFTEEWSEQKVQEFTLLDTNQDGLLTIPEIQQSKALMGGEFVMDSAELLPPRQTVVSELEIREELDIADLDVQLSITHTRVGNLDAYLTGPDGTRIELFTEVGGSGDHFQGTIFDDDAETPIIKARPPFEGRYLPEGKLKRAESLDSFVGKSATGVWQLAIHGARSERFGMLHEWKLLIRPASETVANEIFAGSSSVNESMDGEASTPGLGQPVSAEVGNGPQ